MAPKRRNLLAARVAGALAETEADEVDFGLLDQLLTDCAAEALSLRAAMLARKRRLEGLFTGTPGHAAASEEVRTLATRNEREWEEWRELSELIGELRARRDSLVSPAHGLPQRHRAD
jgi:hypothetical protein